MPTMDEIEQGVLKVRVDQAPDLGEGAGEAVAGSGGGAGGAAGDAQVTG